jgi:CubicO group peptidase (beta-lactamase class C family)
MHRIDPRAILTRRALLRGGVALGAASALPLFGTAAWAQQAELFPNLARMARRYVDAEKVANMIAYVARGEEAPVLVGSGRDAFNGRRKSDADSLYRIYSMTKPITGMAAMLLVDDGVLKLDQPVAEILPKFEKMQVQKRYDGSIGSENLEPAKRPITIRQLLTHTSGLGYALIQRGPIRQAMFDAGVVSTQLTKLPLVELAMGYPVNSLEKFADRLAGLPLVYQPGTRWSYSAGLDLMGRVIEVASGQAFDAFLKQRIFDPCGMESTFFRVPKDEVARLTTSYGVLGGLVIPIDIPSYSIFLDKPAFPMGGAGLVSSARDYDRFLAMLAGKGKIDGRRVIGKSAVRDGTANLLEDPTVTSGTQIAGFGFGAGGRVGWPGAPEAFGWGGVAGTIGIVDMDSESRAGLYTQYMPVFAYPVYEEFAEALVKDLALA